MKKAICIGAAVLAMSFPLTTFCAETESDFIPTFEQTASAWLDQGENEVKVTVDLTDGWSVEFAKGAAYLYDGTADENAEAAAIGLTLDEEVFTEYMEAAQNSDSYREFAHSFTFT